MIERLQSIFKETLLEILAGALLRYPHLDESAGKILRAYDEFVGILADDTQRKHLDTLGEEEADNDEIFQRARRISRDFRNGLMEFFFDEQSGMVI